MSDTIISFAETQGHLLPIFWYILKNATIESDSLQRMMSRWNHTESGSMSTNLEIEMSRVSDHRKLFI